LEFFVHNPACASCCILELFSLTLHRCEIVIDDPRDFITERMLARRRDWRNKTERLWLGNSSTQKTEPSRWSPREPQEVHRLQEEDQEEVAFQ